MDTVYFSKFGLVYFLVVLNIIYVISNPILDKINKNDELKINASNQSSNDTINTQVDTNKSKFKNESINLNELASSNATELSNNTNQTNLSINSTKNSVSIKDYANSTSLNLTTYSTTDQSNLTSNSSGKSVSLSSPVLSILTTTTTTIAITTNSTSSVSSDTYSKPALSSKVSTTTTTKASEIIEEKIDNKIVNENEENEDLNGNLDKQDYQTDNSKTLDQQQLIYSQDRDESNSGSFLGYFLFVSAILIVAYLVYHNKSKVIKFFHFKS